MISFGQGIAQITCDSCDKGLNITANEWNEAINEFKDEGWIIRNYVDGWYNYCSEECKEDAEE